MCGIVGIFNSNLSQPELRKLIASVRRGKAAPHAHAHDRRYELMLEGDATEV